jgi:hypothetical protein
VREDALMLGTLRVEFNALNDLITQCQALRHLRNLAKRKGRSWTSNY